MLIIKQTVVNNSNVSSSKLYWFLIFILAGFAFRLIGIVKQSLWLDEITSLQVALSPLEVILSGGAFDNFTPPLYYFYIIGENENHYRQRQVQT
jgi:hypothetical protein